MRSDAASVAATILAVACASPRPAPAPLSPMAQVECAVNIAVGLGFQEPRIRSNSTSASLVRYRMEGNRSVMDLLNISVRDSILVIDAHHPDIAAPSLKLQHDAESIRRRCGRQAA